MQVETIEFKDVRGKELLYLKITSNQKEVLINVGKKTFDSVKELETPKQPEIPGLTKEEEKENAENAAKQLGIKPIVLTEDTNFKDPNRLKIAELTEEQKETLRKNMQRK